MIVVSNTTPLSELAKVGKMYLLRDIFERVVIPVEVYDEVTTGNHPAVRQVSSHAKIFRQRCFSLPRRTGILPVRYV